MKPTFNLKFLATDGLTVRDPALTKNSFSNKPASHVDLSNKQSQKRAT